MYEAIAKGGLQTGEQYRFIKDGKPVTAKVLNYNKGDKFETTPELPAEFAEQLHWVKVQARPVKGGE